MNFSEIRCPWGDTLKTCAITVCDREGIVLYQNNRSVEVNGDVCGRSMLPCHSERSRQIIDRLINNGENNAYTIQKRDLRKLIYQTPWHDDSGCVAGLVEFSLEIPAEMPHYVRE
ncbi:MAG: PAS sensor protein [Alistipes sp.]|nr:PAS sensor protein [Alistipes sp.]